MRWDARIGRRLKLRDLHILLAVVQSGSMAKAATQLAVSQPAVSKAIAEMEYALGVRLLERSPQGVEPTRYGEALVRRGTAVFNELNQGVKEIEFLADPTVGELRIGTTEPFAAAIVAPIVDDLSQQYPRISFHIVTGDLGSLLHELRGRNIELAMSRLIEDVGGRDLIAENLFDDPYVVVAGAQHPVTRKRKLRLADLLCERWVLPPYDTVQGRQISAAFRASKVDPPQPTIATMSLTLRNSLLTTGHFLTMLPSFSLSLSGNASLRALAVDLPGTRRPIALIRLKDRSTSPLAEMFMGKLVARTRPLAKAPHGLPQRAVGKTNAH
jgi:DNA-binding transcriptional LysR family regulator